jgi:hypothetical protein
MKSKISNPSDSCSYSNVISGSNITANQGGNNNKIHQNLVPTTSEEANTFKEVLEELKISVIDSTELSSSEKLETLKQIDILEKSAHSSRGSESQNSAKKAISSIFNTVGKLPDIVDLLKKFQGVLPFLSGIPFLK